MWFFENWLNWASSQVLAIYTVDNRSITSHLNCKSCQAIWLTQYSSQINQCCIYHNSMASEKQRKVYWQSVMNNARFIHCREGNFNQITTQGKHAYFKYKKFEICHQNLHMLATLQMDLPAGIVGNLNLNLSTQPGQEFKFHRLPGIIN